MPAGFLTHLPILVVIGVVLGLAIGWVGTFWTSGWGFAVSLAVSTVIGALIVIQYWHGHGGMIEADVGVLMGESIISPFACALGLMIFNDLYYKDVLDY